MPNFNKCLRPDFTKAIYRKLKQGDSLNLVGGKGTGRSRLLDDLAKAAFEEGILTIRINLSPYKHNYQGFIDEVNRQQFLPLPEPRKNKALPTNVGQEVVPFAASLSPAINEGKQVAFLLLDDFDRILDNPQQHFPQSFFDDLNALKNQSNVSLCCVTTKAHSLYKVYYRKEDKTLEDKLSWLNLQIIDIPILGESDIRGEMNRQLQHNEKWQEEKSADLIVKAIVSHPFPTVYKDYLVSNYPINHNGQVSTKKWLKKNRRQFKKHNPRKTWLAATIGDGIDWLLERLLKASAIFKNVKGDK